MEQKRTVETCPVCGNPRAGNALPGCVCAACGFESAFAERFAGEMSRKLWAQKVETARRQIGGQRAAWLRKNMRFTLGSGEVPSLAVERGVLVKIRGNETVETEEHVLQYDATDRNTTILRTDGTVQVTGDDSFGQCATGGLTGITYILSGSDCTFAVSKSGSVEAVGALWAAECRDWHDICALACGTYHLLGLQSNGRVCLGGAMLDREVLEQVKAWCDVTAVAAATDCSVALRKDGTVAFAGRKTDPRSACKDWTDIVSVNVDSAYVVGLTANGEVRLAGSCNPLLDMGRSSARNWKHVAAIACSRSGIAGITENGELLLEGNFSGNLQWVKDAWKKQLERFVKEL